MSGLIEYICAAHREPTKSDPLVTSVGAGAWAFCLGGAEDGHDWRKIEPAELEPLRSRPQALLELLNKATT